MYIILIPSHGLRLKLTSKMLLLGRSLSLRIDRVLFVGCLVMFSPPSNAPAMEALYYVHVMSQTIWLTQLVELVAPCCLEKPHRTHLNISIALVFFVVLYYGEVVLVLADGWWPFHLIYSTLWSMSRTVQTISVKVVFCFPYTTLFTYQCHGQHGYQPLPRTSDKYEIGKDLL